MIVRTLISVFFITVFLWAFGATYFINEVERLARNGEAARLGESDGIVVLTGGAERINAGFDRLKNYISAQTEPKAQEVPMMISGVHPAVDRATLLREWGKNALDDHCCITLDRAATTTFENALETRKWAEKKKLKTLEVLTSHYHMPRALLLFKEVMPEYRLIPISIRPDPFAITDPHTLKIVMREYHKWLITLFDLTLGLESLRPESQH